MFLFIGEKLCPYALDCCIALYMAISISNIIDIYIYTELNFDVQR